MADATQRSNLRSDTGTDATSLPDAEIDAIYEDGESKYSDATSADAYARVVVFRRLMAQAAPRTSYKQNQSTESLSDMFKAYADLLKQWESALAEAVIAASTSGAARWGGMKKKPTRLKEFPDA
jgi:hypothetical protein